MGDSGVDFKLSLLADTNLIESTEIYAFFGREHRILSVQRTAVEVSEFLASTKYLQTFVESRSYHLRLLVWNGLVELELESQHIALL